MTSTTIANPKPILPALGGIYDRVSGLGQPLVRVTAGLLLMPHGAQKLFGWFGGHGLEGTAGFFAKVGLEPAFLLALVVALVEFFGGLLLAVGFLTRPVAVAIAILMAVAVFHVHLGNGFFWNARGYEYPLFWGLVAIGFALSGGGRLSIDRRIGREF